METLIVGERGQITIPKEIRRQLGIEPKQPVQVEVRDNMLCIHPVLAVSLRVFSDTQINDMVQEDTLDYGERERILKKWNH
ncbi:MAG: AbrB/MazE/SpoVT family DNA-binding domain-containing protein [Desulfuromonadaceae bacterium]|nr:AbrB/MazE/SpoVT family DNA-binding domain-containing protein [Desulfuromonadaceae bacterium]